MHELILPLIIGILVMTAIYIVLSRIFGTEDLSTRRALAIFGAGAGIVVTFWLRGNPAALREYTAQIAIAGIGVVLALLALAKRAR